MEGRWGRRIFGTVQKGDGITTFWLGLETREGNRITRTFRTSNEELEQWPDTYGYILDWMVDQIDQRINPTQGAQQ